MRLQWLQKISFLLLLVLTAQAKANQPPAAHDQTVTLYPDVQQAFVTHAVDPERTPLVFRLQTPPTHGQLSGFSSTAVPASDNGSGPSVLELTYQPAAGFSGEDSFDFSVNDGAQELGPIHVTLRIVPPAAPVVTPQALTLKRGQVELVPVVVQDANDDAISAIEVTLPSPGGLIRAVTPDDESTYGFSASAGLVFDTTVLTTNPSASVTDEVWVTATDSYGLKSDPARMQITVVPNEAPVARFKVSPALPLQVGSGKTCVIAGLGRKAVVTVDASASADPEGDEIRYQLPGRPQWSYSASFIMRPLPVGTVPLSVSVTDGGFVAQKTDTLDIVPLTSVVSLLQDLLKTNKRSVTSPEYLNALLTALRKHVATERFTKTVTKGDIATATVKLAHLRRWAAVCTKKDPSLRQTMDTIIAQMETAVRETAITGR